ncbi:MAG: type IV pilus secretin PilQ [Deltaproteobacteria bacterium]|nr:type IV pilus secretin PilQ [Deltaproteobacteria bacterium]
MKYSTSNKNIVMVGFGLFVLIFVFGCAEGLNNQKKDDFMDKWSTLAENSEGHSPSAETKKINVKAITEKQVPSTPLLGPELKKLPVTPIHLTMRQADLKAVLRAMAKSVGMNILVKNELKGEISVDFKGVPWDKAFTGLLRTYGLSYVWEGNIIRVMTTDDVEQDLKRKVQLRDIQWVDPLLEPVVINIDYADPKKLGETLQDFLTKDKDGKARGSVKVDEHSNSLVISATRDDLAKILPIIEKLDKPTPQILIKANIVETTKGIARDLGIMWGGYNKSSKVAGNDDLIVTGGGTSPLGSIGGKGLGVNFPADTSGSAIVTPMGALGLLFGKIGGNLLEVQLQALQQDNKLNILSSPSITTLDNQKAYTENGERVPFVTLTSVSGGTPTQTTTFVDVVLRLEITPHVIDGKNLKMTILVKKDEVDTTRKDSLGDPYIIKKQTETVLIVQDGETIVISGLTKQTKLRGESGWPWLKDIPVLGWAFKSDSKSDNMEEVLIFITPHVLQVGSNNQKASSVEQNIKEN